jgi:hypothetical protein
MITTAVIKYSREIMDARIKNLLKNPAKGGTPAMENKIIVKVSANIKLEDPMEIQLAKYFGYTAEELVA